MDQNKAQTFPKLIALMKIFAAMPPVSVDLKRLFSNAGIIYANKHRNRLSSKRAQDILIIKCNCRKVKMGVSEIVEQSADDSSLE